MTIRKFYSFTRHLAFSLMLLVLQPLLEAKAQTIVEASIDTAAILVGEQVQVKLKCTVNAGQHVVLPTFQSTQEIMPGVEVVGNGLIDTLHTNGGKRVQYERRYTITSFDSALYRLPPFVVLVDGKKVPSRGVVGLKVNTIDVDTVHVDQMRPPKDVVDQPFEWNWTALVLNILAWLLAGIALAAWMRLSDPRLITRRVVVRPPTPPHVTAVANIERIRREESADLKAYYMQLTGTLREYIECRFGFNAKEMTTSEIVDRLTHSHDDGALAELQSVLRMADLVKFAKLAPSTADRDHNLMQALDYVQQTKLEPEHVEKPRVEYVTLNDRKQARLRRILLATAVLTTAAAIAVTIITAVF